MVTVGMGLAWLGYSLMFWGYCEIKGYDISLIQIMIPGKYTGSWPPGVTTPGATTSASGASTATAASTGTTQDLPNGLGGPVNGNLSNNNPLNNPPGSGTGTGNPYG